MLIAEDYYNSGGNKSGTTAIEAISYTYGAQAVVISVDPKRQYLAKPEDAPTPPGKLPPPVVLKMADIDVGPNGERCVGRPTPVAPAVVVASTRHNVQSPLSSTFDCPLLQGPLRPVDPCIH